MMISNFLNTKANETIYFKKLKKSFIFVFFLLIINSIQGNVAQIKFTWLCNNNECHLYAATNQNQKILIYKGEQNDKDRIGFKDYGNNLGSFVISCGSPCNYTTFINFQTGEVSKKSFFLVKAIDPYNQEVAYLGKNIEIAPIFGDSTKKISIKRNYSAGAALSVGEIKFVNGNTIFAKYVSGKNFLPKEEDITFDSAQLK